MGGKISDDFTSSLLSLVLSHSLLLQKEMTGFYEAATFDFAQEVI